MSYVLGTATAAGAPLRKKNTALGDGWDSLAAAYGVTASAIIKMQPELAGGFSSSSIQKFIKNLPGWRAEARFPFDPQSNPGTLGPDGKPEGWAFFTENTQIMLPDVPRLDGRDGKPAVIKPTPTTPTTVKPPGAPAPKTQAQAKEEGMTTGQVVGVVAALGALAFLLYQEEKKPTSTAGKIRAARARATKMVPSA